MLEVLQKNKPTRVLIDHFFRRFFDSDTLQVEGETLTTVVRAIAIVASPSLMASFFMQNQYPRRSAWGAIEDHYLFVLFTFLVMASVTIFEWEMLFPDRWDFLILSPLPIRPLQMLGAKAVALTAFLSLFLLSSSIFGTIVLPAVSKGDFFRHLFAHAVAVTLAGLFAALCFLAAGGVLLCILGGRRFRMISPYIQAVAVAALVLLFTHYLKYGDDMQSLLTQRLDIARWMPPIWFLGVYEHLLHGNAASAFALPMAHYAVRGIVLAASLVALTYPLAWTKMRAIAIEGAATQRKPRSPRFRWLQDRVVPSPAQRAIFIFIGQTISRNNQYQVYLAMYLGTGLGLALACALTLTSSPQGSALGLSPEGLRAQMPLLLFWVVVGLRAAFAFPLNLTAGWIFRITGVSVSACADASRRWMLVCASSTAAVIFTALTLAHLPPRHLIVQAICGACLSVFLVDVFFALYRSVPFNKARMPGRTSLPLVLTLYIGIFPLLIIGLINLERQWEAHLTKLLYLAAGTALTHIGVSHLQQGPDEVEEEMEGYEGEFQILGLS
jgi:hypothetical protein